MGCGSHRKDLTAAARSIWPGAEPLGLTAPCRGADGAGVGLVAVGTGGLPGSFGAAGLEATGGGGAGFFPTGGAGGGGFAPTALDGLEAAGVVPAEASGVFFHGVIVPLGGAIPGNTDTGLAEASAVRDCTGILGCRCVCAGPVGFGATAGAAGGAGGRRGAGGGAGGGAGAAFGFGGTSSR